MSKDHLVVNVSHANIHILCRLRDKTRKEFLKAIVMCPPVRVLVTFLLRHHMMDILLFYRILFS